MSDVQIHFLDPINEFLGKPHYGSQHSKMLAEFDDLDEEALRAAAGKVCEEIKGRSAPEVKRLRKYLAAMRQMVVSPAHHGPSPWDLAEQQRIHFMRRKEAAYRCRCNLGRRADKEGWLPAMLDFTEDHGRIPEGREIDACIVAAKRSENALYDGKGSPFYHSLVVMRLNMLERASIDVFGDEAIKRTPEPAFVQGQQWRRAGSGHAERLRAEDRLQEIIDDYEPLPKLSPLAAKAIGIPALEKSRPKKWSTDDVDTSE